jgi:hypothetical protein
MRTRTSGGVGGAGVSPAPTQWLPVLYLRGLSTGDFGRALKDLLGEDACGLSASSIQRLTETWREEHRAFQRTPRTTGSSGHHPSLRRR